MVARMERFLEVEPQVLAHDLHPDYQSTRYAKERPARLRIGVQHHHAHVAAAMAEHGLKGPVLGVAFDGTGLGTDGTAWGGEFLLADYGGFERLATMRAMPLVGGERAIREAWRVTLAVLDDAFDGAAPLERLPLFEQLTQRDVVNVRHLLRSGFQVIAAHGVGRAFDAAGALVLGRPRANFEAQLAMALEQTATGEAAAWPFELSQSAPWQLDLRPMWRAMVGELIAGVPAPVLAARFHVVLPTRGWSTRCCAGSMVSKSTCRGACPPVMAVWRWARPSSPRRGSMVHLKEFADVSRGSRKDRVHRWPGRHGGFLRSAEAGAPPHRR